MKLIKLTIGLLLILVASACSTVAPRFQPDFEVVNELKDTDLKGMTTGNFTAGDPTVNKITIRGGPMVSPYNKSYAEYLKKALEEQLKQAFLWDDSSNIVISGVLLKNKLDGSGISVGESDLSARFIVAKEGREIYNKAHSIHHEWKSNFVGAIAIPNAINNYQVAVQKLLKQFLLDEELFRVLKE